MRNAQAINDLWNSGGPFLGTDRSHGRVTVEPDWFLTHTAKTWGSSTRGPFRWFQREDNSQVVREIPGIKSIAIDRSVDQDAATCTIVVYNQRMDDNDTVSEIPTQLGNPGYYTPDRGRSPETNARWNQSANIWENVLTPNALLRTYEGFGGYDDDNIPLPIGEAVDAGNLLITGTWLVDSVSVGTDGMMTLSCRDMGKLLVDQQLYPPLIPADLYPIQYCRWTFKENRIKGAQRRPDADRSLKSLSYGGCTGLGSQNSGSDVWYGPNGSVHGHRASHAFDKRTDTFWLSVGNSDVRAPYAVEWIEACSGGQEINEVYVHPWAGNYQMFVSIFEDGKWVPGPTINYNPLSVGLYTGANTAEVPYVLTAGVPWETGTWYTLPRTYKAQKIRFTFTNLTHSQWGPYTYRAGVREIQAAFNKNAESGVPLVVSAAAYPVSVEEPNAAGYWMLLNNGDHYAFGDARKRKVNITTPAFDVPTYGGSSSNVNAIAINAIPAGNGYWVMHTDGMMVAHGAAEWYGDPKNNEEIESNGFRDFAPTPTGLGYWILRANGNVYAYGDAVDHGGVTVTGSNEARSIESHPTDAGGYWILQEQGPVTAIGTVNTYSSPTEPDTTGFEGGEYFTMIRRTSRGEGDWIVYGSGIGYVHEDASHHGDDPNANTGSRWAYNLYWDMIPYWPTNHGYALPSSKDVFLWFGDFEYFGSVQDGTQVRRFDGNYKDYADIIKDLVLWSGWLLYQDPDSVTPTYDASAPPPVLGRIETTGSYSDECLPADIFDKNAVADAIVRIKEAVGYFTWVDEEGGYHFELPNWWAPGNFDENGFHVDELFEVDESVNMVDYQASFKDDALRSEIIIATEDPEEDYSETTYTRFIPYSSDLLRGMVKPAMWVNGLFVDADRRQIMAELIAMHIWFSKRQGQTTCVANPNIQINDQVRLFERQSAETYIHYVRGVSTNHDLDTGVYTMTLTTHWLGDHDDWSIVGLGDATTQEDEADAT